MGRQFDGGRGTDASFGINWRQDNLKQAIFHAGLQQFACQVSYVTNLETGGKVDPESAYIRLQSLFEQLGERRQQQRNSPQP